VAAGLPVARRRRSGYYRPDHLCHWGLWGWAGVSRRPTQL